MSSGEVVTAAAYVVKRLCNKNKNNSGQWSVMMMSLISSWFCGDDILEAWLLRPSGLGRWVIVWLWYIPQSESVRGAGAGIAQWLEHRARDWKVAGSNPCWNGGRILFSRVDFLCWLLFRYPFHPRVTTVARKKSRSFCQKVQVAGYS